MPTVKSALESLIAKVLDDPQSVAGSLFREVLQAGLQDLIDAQATVEIGARRYERSQERTTRRNGHRPKTVATRREMLRWLSRSCVRDRFIPRY